MTTATAAESRVSMAPLKRGADIVLAVVLLLLTAPLFGIVALLVRTTSHGPVFHRDPLAGRRGHTVELLHFRTLIDGAATESHARLRAVVGAADAHTPIGRRLEQLRLNRLPRLINVLRGESSIFG